MDKGQSNTSLDESDKRQEEEERGGEKEEERVKATSLTKLVTCPGVKRLRIFNCSCIMPETTQFKLPELPILQKEKGVMRLLIIAGNLTHFLGDLDTVIWEYLLEKTHHWDHIVFVAGPFDYGLGDVATGDKYLMHLSQLNDRLTVLSSIPGITRCVYFMGPKVRILGAPCWPADTQTPYAAASVYEMTPDLSTPMLAVGEGHLLTVATARQRLGRDVAAILGELRDNEATRSQETRILVTYGCPADALTDESPSPFSAVTSMGTANMYQYYYAHVDQWIYGARGTRTVSTMGPIICRSNMYVPSALGFQTMKSFDVSAKAP